MRITLHAVALQHGGDSLQLKARQAILEITEGGEWRVHLLDLKAESLALLEEYFTSKERGTISMLSLDGGRTSGTVHVARVSFGNSSSAVLQGESSLP